MMATKGKWYKEGNRIVLLDQEFNEVDTILLEDTVDYPYDRLRELEQIALSRMTGEQITNELTEEERKEYEKLMDWE